jgi:hypothetical protein
MPIHHTNAPIVEPKSCPVCGGDRFLAPSTMYSLEVLRGRHVHPSKRAALAILICVECRHVMLFSRLDLLDAEGPPTPREALAAPEPEPPRSWVWGFVEWLLSLFRKSG